MTKRNNGFFVLVVVALIVVALVSSIQRNAPSPTSTPIGGAGTESEKNLSYGCTLAHNGSWIAHELNGDPGTTGSITLSLRGVSRYNATMILRVPTVIVSNATHFQIEFLMWETVSWTLVEVTVVEAQYVYWDAYYKG